MLWVRETIRYVTWPRRVSSVPGDDELARTRERETVLALEESGGGKGDTNSDQGVLVQCRRLVACPRGEISKHDYC